jgi:hypothetical protein
VRIDLVLYTTADHWLALALMTVPLLAACTSTSVPDATGSPGTASTSALTTATSAPVATATAGATSIATAATSSVPAPAPAPTADPRIGTGPRDVDEVVPGVSIGPVKLGMTRAELEKLGLWVRPFDRSAKDEHVLLVGPYYVVLRDGRVASIESTVTQMPKGLKIRGQVLPWRSKFEAVAAAFEDCEPMVLGLCGNWFRCEGKRLLVKSSCGAGMVHVQIFAEPQIDPWEKPSPDGGTD